QRDRVRLESPGDECQGVRRRTVEPLEVVDEQQDRCRLRTVAEQMQNRERDLKWILVRLLAQAKCAAERHAIGIRQSIDGLENRVQELVKSGEWQVRLRLNAGRGQDS